MAQYMRRNAHDESRVIVMLTDGWDNASQVKGTALQRELQTEGMPMLNVVFPPEGPPFHGSGNISSRDEKMSMAAASLTGGLVFAPKSANEMVAAVAKLSAALKNRYEITFTTENPSKDGRQRRIDVALDKTHQKAKAEIRAPQGYYAPPQ